MQIYIVKMWTSERNVSIDIGDPIDLITMNRDRTFVATAARTGLKILSVDATKFELKFDLRKSRKTSMHNIYMGLAWNPLKDNLLASSLLNGTVQLWDLNKYPAPTYNVTYPEHQYRTYKQAITSIAFSEFNEHLLVSGSKEGAILLYDMRQKEPRYFTQSGKEAIRDMHFCMDSKSQDVFVTADDGGTIRFWDFRRPDRMLNEFLAHSSGVVSIALHPQLSSKHLMATGGRDRFVRVWDCSKLSQLTASAPTSTSPEQVYSVETISALTRVSWCHDNAWHLATCGGNDNAIHMWDVRRPYLPYASFMGHSDVVTDMCWPRYGSSDRFVSAGKDGRLVLNFLDQGSNPLNYANTVALSCGSAYDGVVVALPERKRSSSSASAADVLDPFRRNVPSVIFCAVPLDADASISRARTIAYLAKHYKLFGYSLERLCSQNADVAENAAGTFRPANIFTSSNSDDGYGGSGYSEHGAYVQLAYAWRTVALLCAGTELTAPASGSINTGGASGATNSFMGMAGSSRMGPLITRVEYYRRTIMGRDMSFDAVDGSQPNGNALNSNQRNSGSDETGKFADHGGKTGYSSNSGSESDESSSVTSSTSTNDDPIVLQAKTSAGSGADGTCLSRRSGGRQRRRRALIATTLLSGSLSQITQNTLNTDFFFGVNELNLYGMSAYNADVAPLTSRKEKQNDEKEEIGRTSSKKRGNEVTLIHKISDSKQSLLNYSADLTLIKDEAFDFRVHRHSGTAADDLTAADFSSHRCNALGQTDDLSPQRQNSATNHYPSLQASSSSQSADASPNVYTEERPSLTSETNHYSKNKSSDTACASKFSDELAHDSKSANASADEEGRTLTDELVEEVVDLIDDCVDVDTQLSTSCPTSTENSVSEDDPEINAAMYNSGAANGTIWDPLPRIKAMLDYYSDLGDVQTCAAICMVLGEKFFELKLVKPAQIDLWLFGYLELLERLEMWNAAAALIKTCYRLKINQLSNESTFVKSVCASCNAMSVRPGFRCRTCKKPLSGRCAVCEQLVRGVWSSCIDCGHGGHLPHMNAWFDQSNLCPFLGCGHKCVRSTTTNLSIGNRPMSTTANGKQTNSVTSTPRSYLCYATFTPTSSQRRSPYSSTPPPSQIFTRLKR